MIGPLVMSGNAVLRTVHAHRDGVLVAWAVLKDTGWYVYAQGAAAPEHLCHAREQEGTVRNLLHAWVTRREKGGAS